MPELVGEVVGPAVQGHVARGVGCGRVDVSPVDSPSRVAEQLVKEDTWAAAVPVAERVDQGQLSPVHRDGVSSGVAV